MRRTFSRLQIVGSLFLLIGISCVTFIPHTPVYKNLVYSLWEEGYKDTAYHLNRADGKLALQAGYYYYGAGAYDVDKAAWSFQIALRYDPKVLWGHYQLARIYFVQGKFTKALQEINAELAANPANLRALYIRGLIYISMNNLPAAEEDFRNFVAWAPAEWGGYNDLAFVLAKEGKYTESEMVIMQSMQKVPNASDVAWLWNSLGLAQLNQQKYTDAQVSFTKALALAEQMTAQEWVRAYSGNDPALAADAMVHFKNSIQDNLLKANAGYIRE